MARGDGLWIVGRTPITNSKYPEQIQAERWHSPERCHGRVIRVSNQTSDSAKGGKKMEAWQSMSAHSTPGQRAWADPSGVESLMKIIRGKGRAQFPSIGLVVHAPPR